jgi:serine/threonine protein kinase
MANISATQWLKLSPLLDELLDAEHDTRARRLAQIRHDDEALAIQLEALLRQRTVVERDAFLESAASFSAAQEPSLAEQTIGAYTLREAIGHGGMGSVWRAERSDGRYQATVAVKFLNLALLGHGGVERFAREGNLLARLSHPNIARLLDAGVAASNQPYLVLEYIDGLPIDAWCDAKSLSIEQRLRLFLDVLAAVAHAHSNLILHRDLKPSNILVTPQGQVKLLDFGIGKLIEDQSATGSPTELTQLAGRAFTPDFAAPEQVMQGDVTTATDVYALGVLLYLLLTGRHPTAQPMHTQVDRLRAVVETEPVRLSDVIARASNADVADVANSRATNAHKLARVLRGDLDNIVAKALKKAPAERYATVTALADDLRRYVDHEPVSARPDTLGYRVSKFVRRYRLAVGAASATLLVLLAGVVGTTWQAWEAQRQRTEAQLQRDRALRQLDRAYALTEFLTFLLSEGGAQGKPVTVSTLLRRGELMLDKRFGADDAVRVELLLALSAEYYGVGDTDGALRTARRAVQVTESVADPGLKAFASCHLGLHVGRESPDEGARMIDTALQSLSGSDIDNYRRIDCLLSRSTFALTQGRGAAALADAQQARALIQSGGYVPREQRFVIDERIAYAHSLMGNLQPAADGYVKLMDELQRFGLGETTLAALLLNNWALVQIRGGDIRKAAELLERATELNRLIDPDRPVSTVRLMNLAHTNLELGRSDLAVQQIDAAIERVTREGNPRILGEAQLRSAEIRLERGDLDAARRLLSAADATLASQFAADHPLRLRLRLSQVTLLRLAGQPAAATAALQALQQAVSLRAPPTALHVRTFVEGMQLRIDAGDLAGAQADADRALEAARAIPFDSSTSLYFGMAQGAVGEVALRSGRSEEARGALRAAVASLERSVGAEHPRTRRVRQLLAQAGG